MICKQCGTYCEQDKSFCPVCRAPLPIQDYAAQEPSQSQPQNNAENKQTWEFVPPPRWPNPTFDINAVDDLPPVEDTYDTPFTSGNNNVTEQPFAEENRQKFSPQSYSSEPSAQPGARTPIASVGGYDEDLSPRHGSFGRAPQRPGNT